MADDKNIEPMKGGEVAQANLQPPDVMRVPQFRRNIFPSNVVLSAADLADFCRLIEEANERAKNIEYNNLDLTKFQSPEEARNRVNDLVRVEYEYVIPSGDIVRGLGLPRVQEHNFPTELKSFFVSNCTYTKRAINVEPISAVDVFFGFEKPSLRLDLQTFPSNPTENRSVINVYGRDEDWVISTTNRVQEFLKQRASFRPIIHGSGVYDYIIYLIFLPIVIWLLHKRGEPLLNWLSAQSTLLNMILAIYVLLLMLLFARFAFQYSRWLFPPMEYYKVSRAGAYTQRAFAGAVFTALLFAAFYDLAKVVVLAIIGS